MQCDVIIPQPGPGGVYTLHILRACQPFLSVAALTLLYLSDILLLIYINAPCLFQRGVNNSEIHEPVMSDSKRVVDVIMCKPIAAVGCII
jgi:hypothetical protein